MALLLVARRQSIALRNAAVLLSERKHWRAMLILRFVPAGKMASFVVLKAMHGAIVNSEVRRSGTIVLSIAMR
jgi:hypothetical protein